VRLSFFAIGCRRSEIAACAIAGLLVPGGVHADRFSCWETQVTHVVAHSDRLTLGNFELTGISNEIAADAPVKLKFQCTGTFLVGNSETTYNYYCEFDDDNGSRLLIHSADARSTGRAEYVSGSGKFADRVGPAAELAGFPANQGGVLPACKVGGADYAMP
jgi:hypothetical protein